MHGSQRSAIITIHTTEGRAVHAVRGQPVQQEGHMISKKEVCIVRTVLAGMLFEADFCAFIVVVFFCTVTRFPRYWVAISLARVGS